MGDHEVDRLPDGLDPRGLLVAHLDPVGVLELLYERVEIERIGVEVAPEVRALLDAGGIELQLVGQVVADDLEDLVARHGCSGTVAAASDARRSAPAAARRSC